jgi:hypothetical protein
MRGRIYPQAGLRQYEKTCGYSNADTAPPTPLKRLSELGRAALNRLTASKHSDEPQKKQKIGTFLVYRIHPTIPESVLELGRRYYDEEEQNE